MTHDLTQFLTAAVQELSGLTQRIDELSRELKSLKDEVAGLRESSRRDEPHSTPSEEAAVAVSSATVPATNGGSTAPPKSRVVAVAPIVPIGHRPTRPEQVRIAGGLVPPPETPTRRELESEAGPEWHEDHDAPVAPKRPFVKWLPTTDAELPMIETRCRLKAEACRWADQRRKLVDHGGDFRAEVEPKDRELIWQAKQLPDCFLWMSHSTAPNPTVPHAWITLAGCFEALGDAVALIRRILEDGDDGTEFFERAVDLIAEAQSSLRICVARIDGPPTDHDQARVFGWLKSVAMDRQIFIRRYMRLDDPADPDRWIDLKQRIANYETVWESGHKKFNNRKKLLGRIKHKLTTLPEQDGPELAAMWGLIAEDVHTLVDEGLQPSSVELRDLLIGYADRLPEMAVMPKGFQLTMREIDRYVSALPAEGEKTEAELEVSPHVAEVAEMLAGKAAIIIGGDRRPHAAEALERAFKLSELIWIDTRAHESVSGFEPYVARPEVAMVLLAIRWSSHSYGEVQDFCRTYGKPLVRLPGGYNPNQVAAQIHDQCSSRLQEEHMPSL
jgi:hypothetical protein